MVPEPVISMFVGSLLKVHLFGTQPRPSEPETRGVDLAVCAWTSPTGDSDVKV